MYIHVHLSLCCDLHGYICFVRFWPSYVRDRIQSTYTYFASGLAITAVSAYGASRSLSFIRFMMNRPYLVSKGKFVA